MANAVSPEFPALWEKMCRKSFHTYGSYLGMAGNPVEWTDRYLLSDASPTSSQDILRRDDKALTFANYHDRVIDLTERPQDLPPGSHPFPARYARRDSMLTFNIASYSRQLIGDFLVEGGKIEKTEFHSPVELKTLAQKVVVNATGYGARALWKDESIVPIRGQIAWLMPQPEVRYSVFYKNLFFLSRRDGIAVLNVGGGEMEGYNDANEQPDRQAAESTVEGVANLYERMAAMAAPTAR